MSILCIDFGTAKIKKLVGILGSRIDVLSNQCSYPPFISSGKEGILFGEAAKRAADRVGVTAYPVLIPFLNQQMDFGSSTDYWKLLYNVDCDPDSFLYLRGVKKHEAQEYAYPISVFAIWLSYLYHVVELSSGIKSTYLALSPLVSTSAIHGLLESFSIGELPTPRIVCQPFCDILAVWESVQSMSRIMVIDLGANYFVTSFVTNQDNSLSLLDTMDEFLFGGHDIDNILAMQLRNEYRRNNFYIDPSSDLYRQLLLAAERAKWTLSTQESVEVAPENCPSPVTITRLKFSRLIEYQMKQMMGFVHRHVRNLHWDDGSFGILVVGGNARNEVIVRFIREEFPRSRVVIPDDVETCTVRGLSIAGMIAANLNGSLSEYPSRLIQPSLHRLAIQYDEREEVIAEKGQPLQVFRRKVDVRNLKQKQLTLVEIAEQLTQPIWTIELEPDQGEITLEISFDDNFDPCLSVNGEIVKPKYYCSLNEVERKKISGPLHLQRHVSNAKSFFKDPSSPLRDSALEYLQSIEEKLPILLFQSTSDKRIQYVKTVRRQLKEFLEALFLRSKKRSLLSVCSHKYGQSRGVQVTSEGSHFSLSLGCAVLF